MDPSRIDIDSCLCPDGKWQCPVGDCNQKLSRKQTLKQHITSLHDIDVRWEVKQYKLYEFDQSIPVPRSTQAWKRKRLRETSTCSSSASPEKPPDIGEVRDISEQITCSSDSDMEICTSGSDIEHAYTDHDDDEANDDEIDNSETHPGAVGDDAPLYVIPPQNDLFSSPISLKDHILVSCALMSRHNTSDTMFKHQLQYLRLHLPATTIIEPNVDKLKQMCGFEDSFMEFYKFCNICSKVFPDQNSECQTPNCTGRKKESSYFVTGKLQIQLADILSRSEVWGLIQERNTHTSTSRTINDITDGEEYKRLKEDGNFLSCKNNISLSLFTDGIPLFKSSGVSLWPVYLIINELPSDERFLRKNMILWGIWQGNGKPNMTTFLKPMVTDLISLQGEEMVLRLNEENIICKVVLIVATMDLQARAAVLHMTQHNGKFSCVFCLEPGKVVKSCKGHCRCFPYSPVLNLRSDNMIMEDSKNAQKSKNLKTNINGFTGESVLNYLPNFSLKDNIVIDYMHGILLGITKKLLNFWFDSTYFDRPHFIGHKMKEIDVILKKITPPYLVIRLPRKLSNTLHHWKASELRSWLLYYSIPCLKGRLLDVYLTHYSLLVEATQTLLGEGITEDDLQRSDLLLHHFVKSADTLYGDNFLGLNVHNLLHIVPCVRKWGPLWAWSCFCFESFNGEIKKNIHGTGNVCRQIFWYLQAQKQIEKKASEPGDGAVKDFLREMTGHCSSSKTGLDAYQCLVKGKLNEGPAELPQVQEKKLFELSNKNSMKEFSKASKIVRNGFIMYSKACKKVQKRNSFTIRTSGNTVVEVHYYLMDNTSRHVYAVCTKLDTTCAVIERRVPHIRQARTVQDVELHIMKAEDLQQLVVNFKVNDQQFVAFIPNTIERD